MLAVLDAWQLHPAAEAPNGASMSHLTTVPMPPPPPAPKPFVRHLTVIAHNAEPSLGASAPGTKAEPWDVAITIIYDFSQSRSEMLSGAVTVWCLPGADGSEWGTHGARLEIWCDSAFTALADKHEIANLIVLIESAACEAARERCHATRTFVI